MLKTIGWKAFAILLNLCHKAAKIKIARSIMFAAIVIAIFVFLLKSGGNNLYKRNHDNTFQNTNERSSKRIFNAKFISISLS